jgi:DnaA-like protein
VAPAARARTAGRDEIAAAVGGKNGGTDMLTKVDAPRSAAELRAGYRGVRERLMGSKPVAAPMRAVVVAAPKTAWLHRPFWQAELEDFNEQLRALFAGDSDAYVRPFNGRTVREVVARHFGITVAELVGARASRRHSWPRQIAVYICLVEGGMRYAVVQQAFGGRDHSTLRAATRVVRDRIARDQEMAREIGALVGRCKQVGESA